MLSGRLAEMRWRRRARVEADARPQPRRGRRDHRPRLREAGAGERERRALRQRLGLQRVEAGVAEALPPRPLRRGVVGRAFAPRRLELPRGRRLDRRADVVRPGDAAGEHRRDRRGDESRPCPRRRAGRARARPRRRSRQRLARRPRRPRRARRAAVLVRRHRDRVAFAERIRRIDDEPVAGGDAVDDLDRLAEVAAERDRLQVNPVRRVDGGDARALGAEQQHVGRHDERRGWPASGSSTWT